MDSENDEKSMIENNFLKQKESEEKRMKMDADRTSMEKVRTEKDEERFRSREELEMKRYIMEQHCFELAERNEDLDRTCAVCRTCDHYSENNTLVSLLGELLKKIY